MTENEDNKSATIEDAILIAAQAHKGIKDKAGAPYILHPLRMMMRMKTEAEMVTAILHDVVEDSSWTIEQLRERGFSEEVLEAVECVTNRNDESYEQFIERAGKNPIARQVKIADLEDNMDVKRLAALTEKDANRIAKYLRAWTLLCSTANGENMNEFQNNSIATQEQLMPLKESRYLRLTPEQAEISRQRMAEISKMITGGLHEDNKEIFGTDYLNKKA